ncbi:hypothetical protein CH373_14105 [Leptospira perolatii]|uniref:DUF4139 domain-containing protein n=1 Tax=Leptospira perolatii TaxID=2023191 RepID=A0A2M9ZKE9_9LEPT|nr:mucoidy inhibitor MuiA family protein [Leptospira perolatii]PJZ69402.1 hypothetical protein CH360_11670 [Leptospira perolatii]PJZ72537.1 hypothetical protein CH373_14105 [Leptospira perolatii]
MNTNQMNRKFRIRIFTAFLLIQLAPFSSSWSFEEKDMTKVVGRIGSVVVFSDRALVRRNQEVKIDSESTKIRFVNLPASIIPDSIRTSAEGLNISSVSVRSKPTDESAESEDDPFKKKMDLIQKEIRSENDKKANYQEQLKVLNSMSKLTTAETDKQVRVNAIDLKIWGSSLDFLEQRRSEYQSKIRKSDERIEQLNKDYEVANSAFLRSTNSKRWSDNEVEVICSGKPNTRGTVSIEYLVTNVSWKGIYDLHGSSEGGEFRLESRAAIRQYTGEDWNNVEITISGAKPSVGLFLPPLRPWRVRPGKLSAQGNANKADTVSDEENAVGSESTEGEDLVNFVFRLSNRETIISDNSDHGVAIDSAKLKGTVHHIAIPLLSNFVFLRAKIKNTSKFPLVWNDVKVFMDGSFIGSSTLGTRAAVGQEFEMYLGPDPRMELKRTLLKGEVTEGGLLSKTVQIENQWQIEVSNYTKRPRQVTVYDQYPVSADPNISTKFLGSNNASLKKDENGILVWTLNLKPSEKEKFDFTYSMDIPQTMWASLESMNDDRKSVNDLPASPQNAPYKQKKVYNIERMMK